MPFIKDLGADRHKVRRASYQVLALEQVLEACAGHAHNRYQRRQLWVRVWLHGIKQVVVECCHHRNILDKDREPLSVATQFAPYTVNDVAQASSDKPTHRLHS